MAQSSFVAPYFRGGAYNCPHCGAYAQKAWDKLLAGRETRTPNPGGPRSLNLSVETIALDLWVSVCSCCRKEEVWLPRMVLYPDAVQVAPPNEDLDESIKADYVEAAAILPRSPRGAAALLRLCLQRLCMQLGCKGHKIDDDIAALVDNGLPVQLQQALDAVRVIGNNAVHPGRMDLSDDHETASYLFNVLNHIAERMLTQRRKLDELYAKLPQSSRDAIDKRDKRNKGP